MTERPLKKGVLKLIGLILATIPTAAAVIMYFPLWQERGSEFCLSGIACVLLLLAAIPAIRYAREKGKSPSAYVMWLILFIIFYSLSKIAHEMTVISLVGFVSNLAASFFFRAAKAGERCNEA